MNILFWGLTIGMLGKVLIAGAVLFAHTELAHERRIDKLVLDSLRIEHYLTIIGLLMIVVGYALEIYFYDFLSMLTCSGEECIVTATVFLTQ